MSTPETVTRYRLRLEESECWDRGEYALTRPAAIAKWLMVAMRHEPAECVGVAMLDARHRLIGISILYRGTINRTACEPRGIFQAALLANAAGICLFHNHPSGDPSPSAEDHAMTRRLKGAGEILGIPVLDHVITAGSRWLSMRERGLF